MGHHRIKRVPVLDGNSLVGMSAEPAYLAR